jgi:hypothetical protein
MCIDTTILNFLIVLLEMSDKLVGLECSFIGKRIRDEDSVTHSKLFVSFLGSDGFRGREAKLMFHVKIITGMIDKDAATKVLAWSEVVFPKEVYVLPCNLDSKWSTDTAAPGWR